VEEQLLPDPKLAPAYEKVVWLYVYRDFSGNDADRAAERVSLRLGMTAYPQHLLVDPGTLAILADTGRSVESFLAAVGRTRVEGRSAGAAERIVEADARAATLGKSRSAKAAKKALDDPDLVVRYRAVQILAEKEPRAIAADAERLLATPNDPFRFEVCRALAKAPDAKNRRPLEALLAAPEASLNPNVLRIEAAKALGACGDAPSVGALKPFAASGEWRNGLTGVAIEAVAAIGKRDRAARAAAKETLVAAYPTPAADAAERRGCEALAKRVHLALADLTGKKVPFPDTYDAKSRAKLAKSW